jgi:hypothetical protein
MVDEVKELEVHLGTRGVCGFLQSSYILIGRLESVCGFVSGEMEQSMYFYVVMS